MTDPADRSSTGQPVPAWLRREVSGVPPCAAFEGVDALYERLHRLAAAFPECVTITRCGTSAQGEALFCLTIDDGTARPDALAVGLPHPNEPIGALTALHLAERVAADSSLRARLGHRWQVVACADPDGLRMNAGWLSGPFDRAHYARHFYRPAGDEQIEWTFPIDYREAHFDRPIPETRALMSLIDRHRPALLASLHNSELGGVYYYLSRAEPELHPVLKALPGLVNLPLDRGEAESPGVVRWDDAVYQSPDTDVLYELFTSGGRPWPPHGGTSTTYSARYGTLTVLCELPYWRDPAADDTSPTDVLYRDALRAWGESLRELGALLASGVHDTEGLLLAPDAPLWRSARAFAGMLGPLGAATVAHSERPEAARAASRAELASLRNNTHAYRLRFGGMALRALQHEVGLGNVRAPVRAALARLAPAYEHWSAQDAADIDHEVIAIERLVTVQYGAVLAAAAQLCGRLAD